MKRATLVLLPMLLLAACNGANGSSFGGQDGSYTLYESSVVDPSLRRDLHRFSDPGAKEQCKAAQGLWFDQSMGVTRYTACTPGAASDAR